MATAAQQRAYKDAVARGDQAAASRALSDAMANSSDRDSRSSGSGSLGTPQVNGNVPAVNKNGLTGQALVMANHLENFYKNNPAISNSKELFDRYADKVDYFNALAPDKKTDAGTYRPTSVTDYRAWNPGDSMAGRSYNFNEQTGEETGNKNLINPNYDFIRDPQYGMLTKYIDQKFKDDYADMVRNGQLKDDEETRNWYMSYRTGMEDKLLTGYNNGFKAEGGVNASAAPITASFRGATIPGGAIGAASTPMQGTTVLNRTSSTGSDPQSIIAQAQAAWKKASDSGDAAGMAAAHKTAENARAQLGYTGGDDGSKVQPFKNISTELVPGGTTVATPYMDTEDFKKTLIQKARAGVDEAASSQFANIKKNLDSLLSELDSEQGTVNSGAQSQFKSIEADNFTDRERQRELMAQAGWNTTNSGLAIGELNKIDVNASNQEAATRAKLAETLNDIARRQTLARNTAATDLTAVENWKAAQLAQAEADAMMQADERNYNMRQDELKNALSNQSYERGIFESDRDYQLRLEQMAATEAADARDYERSVLESDRSYGITAAKAAKSLSGGSSGGGSSGASLGKVSEDQLNKMINSYGSMITSNPYYKSKGTVKGIDAEGKKIWGSNVATTANERKKHLDAYLGALDSKAAAGAIDLATYNAMLDYLRHDPSYQEFYG